MREQVDTRSLTAVLGAGLRGPAVERALGRHGLTLGHFPQSWEYATLGGWVATRSAGQASTGYGSIDKLVAGLRCVSPSGEIELARPARDGGRTRAAPAAGRIRGRAGSHHRGHGAGAAAARHDPLRGLDVQGVRAGRRGVPGAGAGTRDPRRRTPLRRGRDAPGADPLGRGLAGPARGPRVHRRAPLRGRVPRDPGLRGNATGRRRPPCPRAAHHAARRRTGAGRLARPRLAAAALRGPVPARRAARPRHHGGDARDGGALVRPARPLRGGAGARSAARSRPAARRGG